VQPSSIPIALSEVPEQSFVREKTGMSPLDEVLGGGIVAGCVVVLGAEPGLGKSSLVMQAMAGLEHRVLYASGEESIGQCAERARRLGAASPKIYIVAETDVDVVTRHALECRAETLVIDSIQTLVCTELGGGAGSPAQVRECSNRLVQFAKSTDTSVWVIGHVTNDGTLAGPKTLKHLVDVVLEMEAGPRFGGNERVLRCPTKNRFGATNVVGHFELTAQGLVARTGAETEEESGDTPPAAVSAGSRIIDDLSRHLQGCAACQDAFASDLSSLCATGAPISRAWWEWIIK
jgi:DNA repair protein RadA/Sms